VLFSVLYSLIVFHCTYYAVGNHSVYECVYESVCVVIAFTPQVSVHKHSEDSERV